MKHAKHKIKHDMSNARKAENRASEKLDAYFDAIGKTDENFSRYTSKTEVAPMADWSERKIAARESKDEFSAMVIPHAEKLTLEPTESALEPLQVQQGPQNNAIARSKDAYWRWVAQLSDSDQMEHEDNNIQRDKASPIVGKVLVRPETMFQTEITIYRRDLEMILELHAPPKAQNANPIIPSYVPREHWLNCALKSLGF